MRAFGFLGLAFKRLTSRPLLSLMLVLTTALTAGFMMGIPVFAGAVSRRILQQEIGARAEIRGWPMFSVRVNAQPAERARMGVEETIDIHEWLQDALQRALRLPITTANVEMQSVIYRLAPRADDETYTTEYLAGVQVVHVRDVGQHITVHEGAPFGQVSDPWQLNVWVEASFAEELVIEVGERYDLGDLFSSQGESIPIVVAGFWSARDRAEHFWPERPEGHFDGRLLATEEQFKAFILGEAKEQVGSISWYYVFDDARVNLDRAGQYIAGLQSISREAGRRLPGGRMDLDPGEDLLRGQRRKASLSIVLFGFSIPVLVILTYFLSSLSDTQAQLQAQEVSILISRGGKTRQVLLVSAIESCLLVIPALPIGALSALLLAHLLGYATGFLSFAIESPLKVSFASIDWRYALVVAVVSLVVRLRATRRASRQTVVSYERGSSRQRAFVNATRALFSAFLILMTLYAYRQLESRGTVLASLDALDPRNDPLVLLAPTLFIISAPLLAAELFVWLMHPVDAIGRFLPWISGYLASINLARAGNKYRASTYRLILSLTLGVFYASLAKSADIWLVDSLRYDHAADLIVKLTAEEQGRFGTFGSEGPTAVEIPTIPSDAYRAVPGVRAATRVGEYEATIRASASVPYYRLLAVERLNLPQVGYFRGDYARDSLGELMNRLAQAPEGILLPSSVAARLRVEPGDTLGVNVNVYQDTWLQVDAKVVGFFDYFPTMYPGDEPALIANLDYLEINTIGILPHDVWLRLEPDADREAVLWGINALQVPLRQVRDLREALEVEGRRLERAGIFGLLSLCFVAGAALAVADVLVHSTTMLRERAVRHAVLRALGLERRAVLRMVILEQVAAVAYGLVAGIACGVLCALIYVPFFPLGNTSTPPVPPFLPTVDWPRAWWIAAITGAAMLLAQVIVLMRLTRARVFQVLRMGVRP
jgi:putative ABC transport system permease protein